jgi:hypothetical protein
MVALLVFILVAYGASNIMVFSSIFKKFRNLFGVNADEPSFLGKLFGCMMCLPFWWGVLLSLFMYSPTGQLDLPIEYLNVFFDGCLASGAVWLVHTIQEKLEA